MPTVWMRLKQPVVLVAVATTFSLAGHDMSVQAIDSNQTSQLMPVGTSSASLIPETIQRDEAGATETIAGETAEERVVKPLILARGVNIAESSLAAAKTTHMKAQSRPNVPKQVQKVSLSLPVKLDKLEELIPLFEGGTHLNDVLSHVQSFGILSVAEHEFVLAVSNYMSKTNIPTLKKTIHEYLELRYPESVIMTKLTSGEKKVSETEKSIMLYYYRDLSYEAMKKEVVGYLEKDMSGLKIIQVMKEKNGQRFLPRGIKRIENVIDEWKIANSYKQKIDSLFVEGHSPDETYAMLSAAKPEWTREDAAVAEDYINQWFEKNDPEMFDILQQWVNDGESFAILHKLLEARRSNPQMSLNTFDRSSFNQASTKPGEDQFKQWFEADRHPFEAGQYLGISRAEKGNPVIGTYKNYVEFYNKAEIDLVRKLAMWWIRDVRPQIVHERLGLTPKSEKPKLKGFYKMYERMWAKK